MGNFSSASAFPTLVTGLTMTLPALPKTSCRKFLWLSLLGFHSSPCLTQQHAPSLRASILAWSTASHATKKVVCKAYVEAMPTMVYRE